MYTKIRKINVILICLVFAAFASSCLYGDQKVVWTKADPLNYQKGAKVTVDVADGVDVNLTELNFMKRNVKEYVQDTLAGNENARGAYEVKVKITRYEEGNAFARFMLIGLGQMYLFGTVDVTEGTPPRIVRTGTFRKQVRLGGIFGLIAKPRDMTGKLGDAIAKGLLEKPRQ